MISRTIRTWAIAAGVALLIAAAAVEGDPEALQPTADSAADSIAAARFARAEAAMEKSR